MSPRTLLCIALAAGSGQALADTVWMKNGDRLTGKVTLLDGGKLLLETAYGGSIPLKWSDISTLESEQRLLVKKKGEADDRAYSLQAGEPGQVVLTDAGGSRVESLSAISQLIKPKPLVADLRWKGNVDAGLDYKRGETDTDDYSVMFTTQAVHGLWRHNGKANYNREATDGVTDTNNWDAEYALDRFLDEHWFWQGRVSYKRDTIEEVRRQRTIGTGPGYQFWDNELGAFSLASLANFSHYEFDNGEKEDFTLLAMKWDYNRYLLGKTVELFSLGEVGKPLSGVADYTFDGTLGLRYKVTDWASLNMRAEKDLVSGAEGDLDETSYHVGFGVGW